MFTSFATINILVFLAVVLGGADAHGFLKSPRARNWIAYKDGVDWGGTASNYPKEYDPQSLNKGGTAGQCGMNEGGRNYDRNLNVFGQPMSPAPQAQYSQGQLIDVEVVLTAHHKGHFEFYACPISRGGIASGDCFKQYRLEFVADLLYGAPKDPRYPYRAYLPPANMAQIDRSYNNLPGTLHRFRLKLPANLSGDLVLLQWHYLTANSCKFDGYDTYAFPSSWGNMQSSLPVCPSIPSEGGFRNVIPEQFWNCAEVSIKGTSPTGPVPTPPVPTPTGPTGGGSCGGGNRGNGVCADGTCCSQYGWCGTTAAHCGGGTGPVPTPPVPTPTGRGPCGGGNRGNGVCADGTCCSQYGWCGTTAAHCGPNPPAPAPTPIPAVSTRSFRSFHGTYLSAWNDGTIKLQNAAGGWERWSVMPAGNGKVTIRSAHGNYLSAWPDRVQLAQQAQTWEQWTVVSNSDGSVSFLSFHGTYLSAWPERVARLAPHNRDWEHWF